MAKHLRSVIAPPLSVSSSPVPVIALPTSVVVPRRRTRSGFVMLAVLIVIALSLLGGVTGDTLARWIGSTGFAGGVFKSGRFALDAVGDPAWAICPDALTEPCSIVDPENVYLAPNESLVLLTQWEVWLEGENSKAVFKLPEDFLLQVDPLFTDPAGPRAPRHISLFLSPVQDYNFIDSTLVWDQVLPDPAFAAIRETAITETAATVSEESPAITVQSIWDDGAPIQQYYIAAITILPTELDFDDYEGRELKVEGVKAVLEQGRPAEPELAVETEVAAELAP